MAIDIATETHMFQTGLSAFATSYAHVAGTDMLVMVACRGSATNIGIPTFNNVPLLVDVTSGLAGTTSPKVSIGMFRLPDPGTMTAIISVSGEDNTFSSVVLSIMELSYAAGTSIALDSAGSNVSNSTATLSETHTRNASSSLTVLGAVISRTSADAAQAWTPNNSMTEVLDYNSTINNSISTTVDKLQENSSGSLSRSSTSTLTGKTAVVGISLIERTIIASRIVSVGTKGVSGKHTIDVDSGGVSL